MTTSDDAPRTHVYRNVDGEEILVVVPWGSHSGRIPPPYVTFYVNSGLDLSFFYKETR